jgi:hypothetical protein
VGKEEVRAVFDNLLPWPDYDKRADPVPAHRKYVSAVRIQTGNHLVEFVHRIDRLLIDFFNHIAAL